MDFIILIYDIVEWLIVTAVLVVAMYFSFTFYRGKTFHEKHGLDKK